MSFRIVVEQRSRTEGGEDLPAIKVYEQTVEELDIRALMQAVNAKKRGPRAAPKAKP